MAAEINDEVFMRQAIDLALNGAGHVSPNPRVGCVIVSNGSIIGSGWHAWYGEAHAEINALRSLQAPLPDDACMYVTLEPCSHTGRTGPCTEAIIASGIKRVVIGIQDPYVEVDGRGITRLREHGIDVSTDVLRGECAWSNRFFIKHVTSAMPYTILKLAQSIDGFIAPANSQRLDMTGAETQKVVHALRAEVDAVMVGIGTVIADDPRLNVREVEGRDPARIVVDPSCRIDPATFLMRTAHNTRTIIISHTTANVEQVNRTRDLGAEVLQCEKLHNSDYLDLNDAFSALAHAETPITSIMCEGGPRLAGSLLTSGLVDEMRVHTAPLQMNQGRMEKGEVDREPVLTQSGKGEWRAKFTLRSVIRSGEDILATYINKSTSFLASIILVLSAALGLSFTSSIEATAQASLKPAFALIDTSLIVLGMKQSDCSIPSDMLDRDRHRTRFHDKTFTEPFLSPLTAIRFSEVPRLSTLTAHDVISSLTDAMELGTYQQLTLQPLKDRARFYSLLGANLQGSFGTSGASVMERFAYPLLQVHASLTGVQRTWRTQTIVFELSDSLWLSENSDDTSDLFEAYANDRRALRKAETFFDIADPTQMQAVYHYSGALLAEVLDAIQQVRSTPLGPKDSIKTKIIETNLGRIAIGGFGDDVYTGNFVLIIDVGGNDVYAGVTQDPLSVEKLEAASTPATLIVDFKGNDTYVGGDFALGAGVGGIGFLLDLEGNDSYQAKSFSLGAGLFGVGIVYDAAGDDTYSSHQNSQGAGIFGIGLLIDNNGNDLYRSHAQAQGFGATRGVGMLFDYEGNDHYTSTSPLVDALRYESHFTSFTQGAALGFRPFASGGIGMLFDGTGNDSYSTDIYGQGVGYWFSYGALVDNNGEDRYQSYQYAQGAGIHFATGVLIDSTGSDVYVSHGVSQGCGHDVGVGMMFDCSGNDAYVVESLSLGAGNANALSVFVDVSGNDAYVARDPITTMGYSDFRRWAGMLGVFVDGGGKDLYSSRVDNDTVKVKSSYGVFIDTDRHRSTSKDAPTTRYSSLPLATTPERLFIQASAAPLKYQDNVAPARDSLARMGVSVLPMLESYIGTTLPRERMTLEVVFPAIYKTASAPIDSILERSLASDKIDVVGQAATIAGKVKSKTTTDMLVAMLSDTSWRKRRLAALTLGQIGGAEVIPPLTKSLADNNAFIRSRAAYSVGEIGGKESLSLLRKTLADSAAFVRYAAVEGLNRGAKRTFDEVSATWNTMTRAQRPAMLRLLSSCDTTSANGVAFAKYYAASKKDVRQDLDVVLPSLPSYWRRALLSPPPTPQPIQRRRRR